MNKPFRSIEQQIRLLQGRRVAIDENTAAVLLREGYYAVVNGYGKVFLDPQASARARDDRYVPGTSFADMHRLFLFDRELRALTFRAIMSVEGTLRSVLSYTFCEHHRSDDAYLDRSCYTKASKYLRGRANYAGDLDWMINTLNHQVLGHAVAERTPDGAADADVMADDVRIAWYRENYDNIPLWVLFSGLTFGNLRYFFALMRRPEQEQVCQRMAEVCGTTKEGRTLTRAQMLNDMETLSDLRNDCAHVERIYDGTYGVDELGYLQVVDVLAAFLAEDDEQALVSGVAELTRRYAAMSEAVAGALRQAGFVCGEAER